MDELRADDPRQVGGYTLIARLGSGGMGQVYFGRSLGGRHVAVKVIRADLAEDQSFRLRFAREVEAARRVSGAFTAAVIDADPDAPIPWLVTDYVHGPSLAEAVRQHGPLPLSAALTLAARLAEGLSAVHAAGVIHRDLKPANVLLAEDGPRLIDFGISQAADFAQITSMTSVLGTPGFIAPELVTGEPVGPRSDIFSMGAVLTFAATGELPFGAGPPDARTLRVLYLAPDLSNVPGELKPLVERCMAKNPADRPTASQFLADVVAAHPDAADQAEWLPEDILAEIRGRPLPEREMSALTPAGTMPPPAMAPVSAGTSPSKPRASRRRRIWAAGAAATVAVLGTVTGLLVAASGPASAALPQPTGLFAVPGAGTAVTIGWNAYASDPKPGQFEILENGKKLTTVPGNQTNYEVTGLGKGSYDEFSVIAVADASHSAPSPPLTVVPGYINSPTTLRVADAAFTWIGSANFTEIVSSDNIWIKAGDTWENPWSVISNCGSQACGATLYGVIKGVPFTTTLHRIGATYTGSVAINDYFICGTSTSSNHRKSTLSIKLTATSAAKKGGKWAITAFTGTMTIKMPYDPKPAPGCPPTLYRMQVFGTLS